MKKITITLTTIILIGAVVVAGYFFFRLNNDKIDDKNSCTEEAKLCSDGSSVARTGLNCQFAPCPKEDLIKLDALMAYEKIQSPLVIKGMARGNWYFEATFPVELQDEFGNVIFQHYAQAKTDWMTTEFVPFEAVLNFKAPTSTKGTLVLKKDNPSGLPENDDELRVPVEFAQATRSVKLYYYNPNTDKDESGNVKCSRDGLVAVQREIPITITPIQDAIKLLVLGSLTSEERAQGITTEYPLDGFSLKGASLQNGVMTFEFIDAQNKSVGGSCRVGILWYQIEETAKQFPEVKQVRFIPAEMFQP